MTIRKVKKTIKAFEFLKNIKMQEKKTHLNNIFKENNLLNSHEAKKNSILKKIASAEAALTNDANDGVLISGYQEKLDYILSLDEDNLLLNELIKEKELDLNFLKLEAQLKIGQCNVISEKIELQKKELIKKIEMKYTIDCT